jgi:arylsulfatase A-like enzyme
MYDEIYRIPMVVAHPDCQQPGSQNDDFVYFHELAHSIIDAAGRPVPDYLDGQSFLPAMRGDHTPNGREDVYGVFYRHFTEVNQRMVRIRTLQLTFNSADPGELYDLVADPYQLNNVYGQPEYESVRLELMARMEDYMRALGDPLYGWFRRMGPVY